MNKAKADQEPTTTNQENLRYLSLFGGKRGWERNPQSYSPRDDGVHIQNSNDEWEWWYFDFSFNNGYKAVATLHYHNIFLIPHLPTMQLFVYPPGEEPKAKLWAVRPGQENYAAQDHCLVRMGDLIAEYTSEGYKLKMLMGDLGIDLIIRNTLPGWKAGSGILWTDGHLETGWTVPVPRGEVEGILVLNGIEHDVNGWAYHDHNWGNFELEERFWGWYWGRIFDPKFTLIYGWVIPNKNESHIVSPFFLGKGDQIIVGTDKIQVDVEETKKDKQYGWEIPMRLRVRCHGEGVEVDGVLETERTVETLKLPRGDHFYHYYRFLASYQAKIMVDGQKDNLSGETLHEFMLLE
jgi:hypothetical protein